MAVLDVDATQHLMPKQKSKHNGPLWECAFPSFADSWKHNIVKTHIYHVVGGEPESKLPGSNLVLVLVNAYWVPLVCPAVSGMILAAKSTLNMRCIKYLLLAQYCDVSCIEICPKSANR